MANLEWRPNDHFEIVIGRSLVECALPARIGYMGGAPDAEKDWGRWFDAWFSILVWTISVEYTQDGFIKDEQDADDWLNERGIQEDDRGDSEIGADSGSEAALRPLEPVATDGDNSLGGGPGIRPVDGAV